MVLDSIIQMNIMPLNVNNFTQHILLVIPMEPGVLKTHLLMDVVIVTMVHGIFVINSTVQTMLLLATMRQTTDSKYIVEVQAM
jgi:hypothetical protein